MGDWKKSVGLAKLYAFEDLNSSVSLFLAHLFATAKYSMDLIRRELNFDQLRYAVS